MNYGALAEPGSVLLARQARARGGLCHRDPPKETSSHRVQMGPHTISIPQISLHSGTNIRKATTLVLAHDVERAFHPQLW